MTDSAFAIYHLPDDHVLHIVCQDGTQEPIRLCPPYEQQSGFVFAPFHENGSHPAIIIRADHTKVIAREEVEKICLRNVSAHSTDCVTGCFDTYKQSFSVFHNALHHGFDKLVLSHTFRAHIPDPMATFLRLVDAYPHSLVYIIHSSTTGLWIGASPEVLLSHDGRAFSTMSLAGTKTSADTPWDEKNRHEQAYVTDYIRHSLQPLVSSVHEEGPTTMQTGNLFHLCTSFTFNLCDGVKLHDVVNALHPTPAVCGLPKAQAKQFILDNERHERTYYSGYVGPLRIDGKTQLHVNIRCVQCHADGSATCYAGSGLLPSSELESEWNEVNRKASSLVQI